MLLINKKRLFFAKENFIYESYWINKFINKFVKQGKKSIVEKKIFTAFQNFKYSTKQNPSFILLKSLSILKPIVTIIKLSKRVNKKRKKKIKLIPSPVKVQKQLGIALSWLVELILHQKSTRHIHNYNNTVKKKNKKRGISNSKKKLFINRFHIASKNQNLQNLIFTKFVEFHSTNYKQLIRRKLTLYVAVANNRIFSHFRWA